MNFPNHFDVDNSLRSSIADPMMMRGTTAAEAEHCVNQPVAVSIERPLNNTQLAWLIHGDSSIAINKAKFIIGSASSVDWWIPLPGISPYHLEFTLRENVSWRVRMLGANLNGAELSGYRLEPGKYNMIYHGDRLNLCPRRHNLSMTFLHDKPRLFHGKRAREDDDGELNCNSVQKRLGVTRN